MDISATVIRIVADHGGLNESEITPDARLDEDLGFDSIAHIEVVMYCESEFEMLIADETIDEIKTVGDLIAIITTEMGRSHG